MAKRRKMVPNSRQKKINKKIVLFFISLIVLLLIILANLFYKYSLDKRTKAAFLGSCNCPAGKCYSDCSRGTELGSCGDDLAGYGPDPTALGNYCYKEAECCHHGAMNCCWAERKYCLPSSCGSDANRCGAAWGSEWPYGCANAPPLDGQPPLNPNSPGNPPPPTSLPPTNPPVIPTEILIPVIPTETIYIEPTVYNPPPTVYQPPTIYRQPTTYNPQPTTYNPQPTTTVPTPTSKPVIGEYIANFENLLQKTRASILDFLSKILP